MKNKIQIKNIKNKNNNNNNHNNIRQNIERKSLQ